MSRMIVIFSCLFFCLNSFAGEVALTIDDLPYVGKARTDVGKLRRERKRFNQILAILKQENVTAAGFVVPGFIEKDQWPLLEKFHQMGNIIGNHTYSHMNLNRTAAAKFNRDVLRADEILTPLLSQPKYFRFPFLATGRRCQKYLTVKNFLEQHGYVIAPVTIDSKDYNINQEFHDVPWRQRKHYFGQFRQRYISFIRQQTIKAERKAQKRVGRPIKHIFLIHMNTINAHFLGDIIQMFRERGYRFISLPEALQDPYYRSVNSELGIHHRRCVNKQPQLIEQAT